MVAELLLRRLKDRLAQQVGLSFTGKGWHDFETRISAAAKEAGVADIAQFIDQLLAAPLSKELVRILARHLTVGETYFFRDQPGFAALENNLLPELLQRRKSDRRLRIWSAGCCTGEEAYSVAILLDRLLPDQQGWNILITATDINEDFLQAAQRGIYGEWSFRGTPDWVRQQYFKRKRNGTYELLPKIRQRVKFSYLNLAEDIYPSALNNTENIDLIFCRNVLMYFSREQLIRIIERFRSALCSDGLLSVSAAETSATLFNGYSPINFPGAIFYRPGQVAKKIRASSTLSSRPLLPQTNVNKPKPMRAASSMAHSIKPVAQAPVTVNEKTAAESARSARLCADEGQLDEAARWCAKAIAADKLNPAFQYLLATIEQERGMYPAAIQALQRTLYLDQDFVLAHFALANLRLAEGRRSEANRHLDTVRHLLKNRAPADILPESDGLTAAGLDDIANALSISLAVPSSTRGVNQ